MKPLRIVGVVLVLAGLVLAFAPTLVSDPGPAPDTFEAVERHARWGILVAFGLLFAVPARMRPWPNAIGSLVLWVSVGYLVARVIGMALDGTESSRQWMFTGIEIVLAVGAAAFLRHRAGKTDS